MDILILNWKDPKNPEAGGAEIIAFELAKRLVKDGNSVIFFCRQFSGSSDQETIDGVSIIRRGTKYSVYLHAFFYYMSLKKKPDRVIDMVNTICWMTPLYVPKKNRILYVNQLAKEVMFYELPIPISYIAYILERFEYLIYKTTRTICYSESTKNDLISFGIPRNHINVFPLGLDHQRYIPSGKKKSYPLFLFVARLVRMKRAALCVDAMKLVTQKYKDAQFFIVGNGPEEQNLQNQIICLGLSKNVFIVGKNNFYLRKNDKDIKLKLMQKAWALILPSVKEGWGMVVTEAASCGTPSIVSNVTGLRDSVIKNTTGLIVSENPSSLELAGSIIRMIEERELRQRLSRNAQKRSKEFTWDRSYNRFKILILS